jgi:uncharacterized protein
MELEGRAGSARCCGVSRSPRRAARPAAGALSLEDLETWLDRMEPRPRVDGVSMLDGYFTAIVVGPCSVPQEEWFVDLLSANGNIGSARGKHLAAILAVAARFNAISEGLSAAPEQHAPIFERMDDGTVLAAPWCMGFLMAMQLRFSAWKPLRDLNRIEHGLLLPILLHCPDELGRPMLGRPREGLQTDEFLRSAYHDIPLVIPAIREFWMQPEASRNRLTQPTAWGSRNGYDETRSQPRRSIVMSERLASGRRLSPFSVTRRRAFSGHSSDIATPPAERFSEAVCISLI